MRVALHTDQLWFSAPGGIGTYVRELSGALRALEDAPDLVTFQVGAGDGSADQVVTGSIRSIYPRWDLTGRPALPFSSDVVHATNHAAIPPADDGTALVVTVHDLAFDVFGCAVRVVGQPEGLLHRRVSLLEPPRTRMRQRPLAHT